MQTSLFWFIYKAILKFMCLWIFCPSGEYSYGNVSCPIPLLKLQNDHVLDILFFWLWPWCFIKKKNQLVYMYLWNIFVTTIFCLYPFHCMFWNDCYTYTSSVKVIWNDHFRICVFLFYIILLISLHLTQC